MTCGEPDRLEIAAQAAAAEGLEVWFSPFTNELDQEELLALFADCSARAECLRVTGAEVIMVTGAELMLFTPGFDMKLKMVGGTFTFYSPNEFSRDWLNERYATFIKDCIMELEYEIKELLFENH
ncbi:DnaA N-terminal domain-containing protein [Cytobacillus purgationiresistens]|uniref:Uncharacterized protein n=1 Tax=Cytobacillus purgationiresistens TaxID=863449 RepID=A0ABU0ABF1_9BACI|nr:hypothetical protein [Cytobacillus purgationiresistens]MDQ0268577.1 hypothetical protein [Cytobacillus purgationiresistens]